MRPSLLAGFEFQEVHRVDVPATLPNRPPPSKRMSRGVVSLIGGTMKRNKKSNNRANRSARTSMSYGEKLALKMGNGKRRLSWMWWTEGEGAQPREVAVA